ncbi:hypothetical protein AAON49_02540 [Pseudotenacibaculum sp. MALMAid0570]|uniref:hypothetical protein n=1 Tax=Pseudotenacibaculum sp. MALMAid0570 TaxID=3143938 RepID=UPI0032DEFD61
MKSITTKFFLLALFVSSIAFSQSKVKERDIIGQWKLHLDLSKEIEENEDSDDSFGKAFARGILKTVNELVNDAEITFDFKRNHTLEITQQLVDDDEVETKKYTWRIDKKGRLITSQINDDNLQLNNDNKWMLKKGKLVSVDRNKKIKDNVWMERVRK